MAARPTGMLMKNTHLQPTKPVINPPRTGPRTFASPNTDERIPAYFPRCRGGNISATTMKGMVMSIPPPIP